MRSSLILALPLPPAHYEILRLLFVNAELQIVKKSISATQKLVIHGGQILARVLACVLCCLI